MKRLIKTAAVFLAACMLVLLAACSSNVPSSDAASDVIKADEGKHVIGVAVYDITDSEVIMMRQYLEEYVAEAYEDVQFIYSQTLVTEDDVLDFIDQVAKLGGEGIMGKISLDLSKEVAQCEKNGMYYVLMSGTKTADELAKVQNNKYFLGTFGPGSDMEYQAGADMATYFAEKKQGNSYFIVSGGAGTGNAAHLERTKGMLNALSKAYGVAIDVSLASSSKVTTVTSGDLTVTIAPGYVLLDAQRQEIMAAFNGGSYDYLLSTTGVGPIADEISKTSVLVGAVDCYSQENQILFNKGQLEYLSGKYGSLIGPSFAALYNAVTGHASMLRDNGKSFQIAQGFWTSTSAKDFAEKYALSANPTYVAYNYEDLKSMCVEFNSQATLSTIKKLAEAYSYEDVKARRGL